MSAVFRRLWPWLPLGGGVARPLTLLVLVVPMLLVGGGAGTDASWLLAWWFLLLAAATGRWVRDYFLERALERGQRPRLDTGLAFARPLVAVVLGLRVASLVAFFGWLAAEAPGVPVSYHLTMLVVAAVVEALLALLDEAARIHLLAQHLEAEFLTRRLGLQAGQLRADPAEPRRFTVAPEPMVVSADDSDVAGMLV